MSNATQTANAYTLDTAHTTIEFTIRHLMIAKVRGRFTAFTGTVTLAPGSEVPSQVDVTIGGYA